MKGGRFIDRAAWALVVLLAFTIPFEKTVQVDGFGTASRLLGILAFLATAAAIASGRKLRAPNAVLVLAAAFTAWMGLTWFWTIAPGATAARALTFLQLFAMAWLVWEFTQTGARQALLCGAYVAGASVASVATILRYMQSQQTYYRRYAAAGFDPNDLGLTVALAIPLALWLSLRETQPQLGHRCTPMNTDADLSRGQRERSESGESEPPAAGMKVGRTPGSAAGALAGPIGALHQHAGRDQGVARGRWRPPCLVRYACWLAIALAEAAVLLSGSRAALIATFIAFAFAALRWRESDAAQRIACAGLLGLLVIGVVRLAPAASRARLATLPSEVAQGSLHGRTRIWKAGLKALKQYPVTGAGAGAYPEAVRPWLGVPAIPGHQYVAHNTFLSVLVEGGAVGLTLFGITLATAVVFVWMLPRREAALWFVMLGVWFAGVSTLTWEQRKPTWLILALIMTAWARAFREEP